MIFISMSAVLNGFVTDEPGVRDLVADPSTRFVFGCIRRYVLEDENRVPHEITWSTDISWTDAYVHIDQLPDELREVWLQFRSHIAAADADQRVWWGLGRGDDLEENAFLDRYVSNYPDARELLAARGEQIYGYQQH